MNVPRTEEEIDNVRCKAAEGMVSGSKWPGMSYEEGVEAALAWITGNTDEDPMGDE